MEWAEWMHPLGGRVTRIYFYRIKCVIIRYINLFTIGLLLNLLFYYNFQFSIFIMNPEVGSQSERLPSIRGWLDSNERPLIVYLFHRHYSTNPEPQHSDVPAISSWHQAILIDIVTNSIARAALTAVTNLTGQAAERFVTASGKSRRTAPRRIEDCLDC
jgi:hypothetical protein